MNPVTEASRNGSAGCTRLGRRFTRRGWGPRSSTYTSAPQARAPGGRGPAGSRCGRRVLVVAEVEVVEAGVGLNGLLHGDDRVDDDRDV
jgi:hypothetical protein